MGMKVLTNFEVQFVVVCTKYTYSPLPPPLIAPPAENAVKENGEANGELKETLDPNAPKKCDVIVISGRKERCDTALEALKVCPFFFFLKKKEKCMAIYKKCLCHQMTGGTVNRVDFWQWFQLSMTLLSGCSYKWLQHSYTI